MTEQTNGSEVAGGLDKEKRVLSFKENMAIYFWLRSNRERFLSGRPMPTEVIEELATTAVHSEGDRKGQRILRDDGKPMRISNSVLKRLCEDAGVVWVAKDMPVAGFFANAMKERMDVFESRLGVLEKELGNISGGVRALMEEFKISAR